MATEEAAKPPPIPSSSERTQMMILEAIDALPRYRSNRAAIFKYIEGKYGKVPLLMNCLVLMRFTGELIFRNNNYFRADDVPPKRGRGRPPKARDPLGAAVKQATAGMPKARGHPPKKAKTKDVASPAPAPAPAPAGDGSTPVKYGRGSPPKKKPQCLQLNKPEYLEQPGEMFHGVAVDRFSSCIPGQAQFVENADGDEEGEDADGDGFDNNPMSTSSRKRGGSSTDTTASPAKKSKEPLLNKAIQELQSDIKKLQSDIKKLQSDMKELQFDSIKDANQNLHQFRSNQDIKEKQEKEEVDQQIDRCLRMAMECGATEESEEYFMATILFEKEYNQKIFCKFNTAEGRFMWLKRWCQRSRG